MPPITDSYVFWTHKGGVGKTTLCLQSTLTYAELHPRQHVIVVDLDEQANLSSALCTDLGNFYMSHERDAKSGPEAIQNQQKVFVDRAGAYSRTLCGMLLASEHNGQWHNCKYPLDPGGAATIGPLTRESSFLINPRQEGINENLPQNVHLLCGDRRIAGLSAHLMQKCHGPDAYKSQAFGTIPAVWKSTHLILKNWLDEVASQLPSDNFDGVTVFMDCNPSMNIFTELGMCAATKLIVPVNADDFSLAAVESMFHSLYGMYQQGGNMASYEEKMFHHLVKQADTKVDLPKVQAIVHNRSAIYGNKMATCFDAMSKEQVAVLFKAYQDARGGQGGMAVGSHVNIFSHSPGGVEPQTAEQFAQVRPSVEVELPTLSFT